MLSTERPFSRLDAKRREQTPQALARLALLLLFMALWGVLAFARIPMPFPFLLLLIGESFFFIVYLRLVFVLPSVRAIEIAHYAMLAAEIVFHTAMVYFLGGISWLGAFAYVFGLIFSNAFLDLRRGLLYTAAASSAFGALILLDATGTIPHYSYMEQGAGRYADPQVVITTLVGAVGVFLSIYAWVNWVGYQLRQERDSAISAQDDLLRARTALQLSNVELEEHVRSRTTALELANTALRESEQRLNLVLETCPDLIAIQETDARYRFVNSAFTTVLGYEPEELIGRNAATLVHPDDIEPVAERFRTMVTSGKAAEAVYRIQHANGRWVTLEANGQVLVDGDGQPTGVVVAQRDATDRKRAERLLSEQRRVLEMIAAGAPLQSALETLVRMIEEQADNVICSVCLANEDGTLLYQTVAPNLPGLFQEALKDGVPVAANAGSCGTAAFRRQPVVCDDIASDELWDEYRNAALNSGLQACWSTPIFSSSGAVLGAFATYYREPRGPSAHEHVLIAAGTHIAGIAIERKRAEDALRDGEQRMRTLVTNAPVVLFAINHQGIFTLSEGKGLDLLGLQPGEVVGKSVFDVYENVPAVLANIQRGLSGESFTDTVEVSGLAFESHYTPLSDGHDGNHGLIGVAFDVTERRRAEEALRESESKFRAMAETVAAAVFIFQGEKMRYVNPAAQAMTGLSEEQLLSMNFWDMVHPEFRELVRERGMSRQHGAQVPRAYEVKIVTKEGQEKWVDFTAGVIDFEGEPAVLGTAFDITERKRGEELLQMAASRDPLTGLFNRRAGLAEIEERLQLARRDHRLFGTMVLDLDKFKSINDSYSHEMGDAALIRFSQVMTELIADRGVICRLGGDEFQIGLDGASLQGTVEIAEQLRSALHASLQDGTLPAFRVSIGVACYPDDGATTEELGRRADEAMYAAKSSGGDRCAAWRGLETREAA